MFLWRNLQEGQLTAVLRWLGNRRGEKRETAAATETTTPALEQPGEGAPPAAR